MKRFALHSIAVTVFSVAFVILLYEPDSEEASLALPTANPATIASPGQPEAAPTAPDIKDAVAPVDFEAIKQRFGVSYDPMLVMALGEFTDEEIDAYNELHVLPFNRAVGKDCEELPDPQFSDGFVKTCKTVRERPPHPYNELPDADLHFLAVHDAVAALLLGRRATDEEERLYWYLRAVALAEKSGPLLALAERRYGSGYRLQALDGKMVPVAQTDAMIKRLALETVAGKLGDPRANPRRWRRSLLETAGDGSAAALDRAHALTTEFLDHMAQIQRQVTGSVQVQEIIDA